MLSVAPISAGAASSGYYKSEGYYAKDSEEAKEASQWYGKGAESAGLTGEVSPKDFDEIMAGFTPDGGRLGRMVGGEHVHRAGTDLTFSAPKSISIMALVGGDKRLIAAHDAAVRETMAFVEERFLQTRMKDPETGRIIRAGGQKLIAGLFRHDASRALDPQLHTHAVTANMTIGEDGKWRTVENKAIFDGKMEIGGVYRSFLASKVHELGYDVEKSGRHGFFEIRGVARDVIEAWSSRRQEIVETLKDSVAPGSAAAAARAALKTRHAKNEAMDRADLYQSWKDESAERGFGVAEMQKLVAGARERVVTDQDRLIETRKALDFAIETVSERHSVYKVKDIEQTAINVMRVGDIKDVTRAIGERVDAGELISVAVEGEKPMMTDAKTVLTERAVVEEWEAARENGAAMANGRQVDRALYRSTMTDGQREAVAVALTGEDRVVGVQGYAGAGKTYMLARAQAIAGKNGYEFVGLAPSHRAVAELTKSGLEANTLQSFLARNEGLIAGRMKPETLDRMRADYANKAIVVDEASMISTGDMRKLLHVANQIEAAKLILVGDVKQLDAVEAGSPFRSLQKAGMETGHMADILRQKNPEMLAAVRDIIRPDVSAFFDKVGDRVEETKEPQASAAGAWLALSPAEREEHMLITQSNDWRRQINDNVRAGLRFEGRITGEDYEQSRLNPERLTTAQLEVALNYHPGERVIFERDIKSLEVEKDETFKVESVRDERHVILTSERDGREISFEPGRSTYYAKSVTLYTKETINIAKGDILRFDRTDLDEGVMNKATGEVLSISKDAVTMRLGGETHVFDKDHDLLRHVDYAWGTTVHGAQGATVKKAIAALNGKSPLSTQKSVYVTASRVTDDITVFTNDRDKLIAQVRANSGQRLDARDVVDDNVRAVIPDNRRDEDIRNMITSDEAKGAFAKAAASVRADDRAAPPVERGDAPQLELDLKPSRDPDGRGKGPEAGVSATRGDAPSAPTDRDLSASREDPSLEASDNPDAGRAGHDYATRESAVSILGDRGEHRDQKQDEKAEEAEMTRRDQERGERPHDEGEDGRDDERRVERASREEEIEAAHETEREPDRLDDGDERFAREEMRQGHHEAERPAEDEVERQPMTERGDDGEMER